MKKNAPLFILVGIVVLLAGFLGYKVLLEEKNPQPPRQVNVSPPSSGNSVGLEVDKNQQNQNVGEQKKDKTKSKVPDMDPEQGEIFVEGEVKAVDVGKRILTIDQHMDDNSEVVSPNVTINKNAIIQNKESDVSLSEIKVGDVVGMILQKDRQARAVLINY